VRLGKLFLIGVAVEVDLEAIVKSISPKGAHHGLNGSILRTDALPPEWPWPFISEPPWQRLLNLFLDAFGDGADRLSKIGQMTHGGLHVIVQAFLHLVPSFG